MSEEFDPAFITRIATWVLDNPDHDFVLARKFAKGDWEIIAGDPNEEPLRSYLNFRGVSNFGERPRWEIVSVRRERSEDVEGEAVSVPPEAE